ncbi:hypothetical protein PULV_a0318 [Pseudoalteromonas ulvae UL12]|uniref:M23 family metallopeptidase n=1 Tax=Pseudoalteromonas ulvae TaxID=107327 RepID=UPI00186B7EB5|nr:M23 family metallopeptidase [Pseudoalteromonas ulvae]MBE0362760.1 hypothetical protein [Pseudoalteromonas ulvae UL12]
MTKTSFILSALLFNCAAVLAKPTLDCRVFSNQEESPYVLPYQIGTTHEVVVSTGHYRKSNQGVGLYALDFIMPIGTEIVAAREGVVVAIREQFHDGNGQDLHENFVFIRHDDGSIARYIHLTHDGALVSEGQRVKTGQLIAKSGDTGQTGGHHLHFDVQQCGPNLPPNYNQLPCGQTIPVTFKNTAPHQCGLQAGQAYRAE